MDFYAALDLVQDRYGYTDEQIMSLYGNDLAGRIATNAGLGEWSSVEEDLCSIGYPC
jgi:hypothetical protein